MNKLHQNLKALRLQAGLSQKDLADQLYTSSSTLSNWERGLYEPDINATQRIAEFFQVSMDELYGRETVRKHIEARQTVTITKLNLDSSRKQQALFVLFFFAFVLLIFSFSIYSDGVWMISLVLLIVSEVLMFGPRNITFTQQVTIPHNHRLYFGLFKPLKKPLYNPIVFLCMYFIVGIATIVFSYLLLSHEVVASDSTVFLGILAVVFMLTFSVLVWLVYPWFFRFGTWPVTQVNLKASKMVARLFLYYDVFILMMIAVVYLSTSSHETPFSELVVILVISAKIFMTWLLLEGLKETLKSFKFYTKEVNGELYEPLENLF